MKSAREIARGLTVGVRGMAEAVNQGTHAVGISGVDVLEGAVTEAIQQARVDGARWAVSRGPRRFPGGFPDDLIDVTVAADGKSWIGIYPADVRNSGDDGDAGKGGT